MAHVSAFTAAHHQTLIVEHLKYENELLVKRNQTLALENERLLKELEKAVERMESRQVQQAHVMAEEEEALLERAKSDCVALLHELDQKAQRVIGKQVAVYRDTLSRNCNSSQIYDSLTHIISKLLEEQSKMRQGQLQGLINAAQGRLSKRRNAREKTQQVVHLIREPPKEMQLSMAELRNHNRQLADIYQRIIRKVKRNNVNVHALEELYEQIDEWVSIRCRAKQEDAKLALMERQLELGKLHPLNHQVTTALLNTLLEEGKQLYHKIQGTIQSLQ